MYKFLEFHTNIKVNTIDEIYKYIDLSYVKNNPYTYIGYKIDLPEKDDVNIKNFIKFLYKNYVKDIDIDFKDIDIKVLLEKIILYNYNSVNDDLIRLKICHILTYFGANLETINIKDYDNNNKLIIPRTLTKINIQKNNIQNIIFQSGITTVLGIDYNFVKYSNLQKINLEELKVLKKIDDKCFQNCKNLTEIELPNSLETLGNECFQNCKKLTKIELYKSLKILGDKCFNYCENLKEIDLSKTNLTEIGNRCFQHCKELTKIKLPNSLITLNTHAFSYCLELKELNLDYLSSLTEISDSCFNSCKN